MTESLEEQLRRCSEVAGVPIIAVRDLGDLQKKHSVEWGSSGDCLFLTVPRGSEHNAILALQRLFRCKMDNWIYFCFDLTNGDLIRISRDYDSDDGQSCMFEILDKKCFLDAASREPRMQELMRGYDPERREDYTRMKLRLLRDFGGCLEFRNQQTTQILFVCKHPPLWNSKMRKAYWIEFDNVVYDEFRQSYPDRMERALLLNQIERRSLSDIYVHKCCFSESLLQMLEAPESAQEDTGATMVYFPNGGTKRVDVPSCQAEWAQRVMQQAKFELKALKEWEKKVKWQPWLWFLGRKWFLEREKQKNTDVRLVDTH